MMNSKNRSNNDGIKYNQIMFFVSLVGIL